MAEVRALMTQIQGIGHLRCLQVIGMDLANIQPPSYGFLSSQ